MKARSLINEYVSFYCTPDFELIFLRGVRLACRGVQLTSMYGSVIVV